MSHFGASVQRPPVPGLQGRAEYPERSRVLPFVQQILVASRSKTAIVSQVLQLPNAPSPWTLEDDSQLFQKPQWGWLQDAAGKRVWQRLPQGLLAVTSFQLGSEPGRFEHHAPPHASQQHKELFELLWHAGVVKSGTRLVPVPLDLIERHRARLTRIFHDSINKDFQTERGGNLDLKIRQNKGKIKVNGKGKGNTQGKMQRRQKGTQKGKRQNKGKTKGKEKVHQNNWKYVQRSYNRQKKGKSEGRKKVEKR